MYMATCTITAACIYVALLYKQLMHALYDRRSEVTTCNLTYICMMTVLP